MGLQLQSPCNFPWLLSEMLLKTFLMLINLVKGDLVQFTRDFSEETFGAHECSELTKEIFHNPYRGGIAEALKSDHRPLREDEKARIQSLGGYVDYCHGGWRLQGSLAVSRGISDQHLKQWAIANADTQIFTLKSNDEFLILASNGL